MNRFWACLLPVFVLSPVLAAQPQKATIPLIVEGQRIFIDAQFVRRDGSLRTARLWVDSGTPDFQISEKLARDLGLDLSGPIVKSEDGVSQVEVRLPGVRIGSVPLDLQSAKPMAIVGPAQQVFAGRHTEGNLPATILMHYQLVMDIPHHRLTLAQPGGLKPTGKQVSCLVQPKTGMVQMDARIDGRQYSLALDTGAPYSMISTDLIKTWGMQHPDWPQIAGAAGPAVLFEAPHLLRATMMRVPEIDWAGLPLKGLAVLGMDAEFVSWYSRKTAAPVVGFLAWNILRACRITIDYPASKVYFEKQCGIDSHDMDVVGLTPAHSRTGGYAILAVVQMDGKPAVDGAQPGDKLLQIDDREIAEDDMQTVVEALAGKTGDIRTLVLERKGVVVTIKAKVMHLI